MSKLILDEHQKKAVEMALHNHVSIIIGKAGSGKSTVIREIESLLISQGWKVSLIAPTGRAAKRIEGATVHRWLEPILNTNPWGEVTIEGFSKKTFNSKECVIVDEASMIDDALWKEIITIYNSTYTEHKKLIFVGDTGQLEPVGDGTPFLHYISLELFPVTELTQIHRQDDGNDILDFSLAIRDNLVHKPVYAHVSGITRAEAIQMVIDDESTIILCPMKNGIHGINALNGEIQFERIAKGQLGKFLYQLTTYDKSTKSWKGVGKVYSGDKVMFTKNCWNPSINMMNGSVGIARKVGKYPVEVPIPNSFGQVKEVIMDCVVFEDETGTTVNVPLHWFEKNSSLAYAITVHKAQGSEWNTVIFSAAPDQRYMISQKLAYTAVTRAKKRLYMIGDK